ncbi:MAG: polysaccharide deacetylase family protein [Victivallales bacterium]|nr:polysaccharide deacetylase family protein [Victivallales bacterium]
MGKIRTVFGFDMETDIGSWTPWYNGFAPGAERILSVLDKYGLKATFFFVADAAQKNPQVLKKVAAGGHEIGAHTLFHETIGDKLFEIPGMMPILPEEVEHRLELNTEIIEKLAGVRPTSFRCPRLWGSTAVCNALERLGYKADVTYPMYFYREQLAPYHPSKDDWTKKGDLKLVEIPNFADLSMKSNDEYGRDMDQWPLWRLEGAEAVMKHIRSFHKYCNERGEDTLLVFYMHPWEFHQMPTGILHYGEGAVLPDPFIVKNCGQYAAEQFDELIRLLKAEGSTFHTAAQIAAETN